MGAYWAEHRARWTLPLVIIVVIIVVAIVDHLGARRISQVDAPSAPALVAVHGGSSTLDLDRPWNGFNPNNPAGASSSTPALLAPVLPSAFSITPALQPTLNTNLLKSVEVTSTTPLTIQYVLNPSAVWSDGVPVSAEDFIYAWQSQNGAGVDIDGQPDQVASTLGYRDIASVTGSHQGKTVTVVFSIPFTDWRVLFNEMVPAHIAEKAGWNSGFAAFDPATELSAGPMMLQSVADGKAVLVPNPSWWGIRATIDQLDVSVTPGTSAWTGDLAGHNQVVAEPTQFDLGALGTVTSLPNLISTVRPSLNMLQLEFDVDSAPTSQVAVRQAIAHSIDRSQLLQQTFGAIDPHLVVNEDHLAVASQRSYAASTAAKGYDVADPSATDRLLASAGYHKAADGRYVDAAGKPLSVRMAVESGDPWIAGVAAAVSSQLAQQGIGVVTTTVDGVAGLMAADQAGQYDMALVTRTSGPFETITDGWFSNDLGPTGTEGSQNWSNFDDPQVDQLFAEAAQQLNPVSGAAIYAQIDDQLWDQMVALPLFGEPSLLAHGVQIGNVVFNSSQEGILWNVRTWRSLEPAPANRTG